MKCQTCKYAFLDDEGVGRCRRYPPKNLLVNLTEAKTATQFPQVDPDWVCGEYVERP
jgi:rubredoxin